MNLKKLGYNHNDIMIWEEPLIAEKIIKLFPKVNIELNKNFNNRKSDIWFKNYIIIEVDEGNHEENSVNGVISKITDDFKKIVAVAKSKDLKRYPKNILPNYKK